MGKTRKENRRKDEGDKSMEREKNIKRIVMRAERRGGERERERKIVREERQRGHWN